MKRAMQGSDEAPSIGRALLSFARQIFWREQIERVFTPIVGDMREEYAVARARGRAHEALAIRVRGTIAFVRAAAAVMVAGRFRMRLVAPLALVLLTADCTTKELAVEYLAPEHVPQNAIGDVVRFTLGYNDGAAMGLPVGSHARWPLVALSLVACVIFVRLAKALPPGATLQRAALGLLLGGTLGNMLSRALSSRGVVDFIDIGFGNARFWIFNVADIGITAGALLLAYTWSRAAPTQDAQLNALL